MHRTEGQALKASTLVERTDAQKTLSRDAEGRWFNLSGHRPDLIYFKKVLAFLFIFVILRRRINN